MTNVVSPEPDLTQPSINELPSAGSSRQLKRTYAVAGQQKYHKHQEKTDCRPLDLNDPSTTIPRETKWNKFSKLDRMVKPGFAGSSMQLKQTYAVAGQ